MPPRNAAFAAFIDEERTGLRPRRCRHSYARRDAPPPCRQPPICLNATPLPARLTLFEDADAGLKS